ncbi:hypothetical protein ACVGXF_10020, partial [Enterobacter hormaechei]
CCARGGPVRSPATKTTKPMARYLTGKPPFYNSKKKKKLTRTAFNWNLSNPMLNNINIFFILYKTQYFIKKITMPTKNTNFLIRGGRYI